MNTSMWSVVTWNDLMQPERINDTVLIAFWDKNHEFHTRKFVKIVGTDHIGNTRILLVNDGEDVCIITREGIGKLWNAYEPSSGFPMTFL